MKEQGGSGAASVLVVDDELMTAEVIGRYLSRAGYKVRVAGDGAAALHMHEQRAADLVVLDITLPLLSGLDVLAHLRARSSEFPRVILVSGRDSESDRVNGLRAGADDYVVKPFSPREIVARVDAILRRKAPVAQAEPVGAMNCGPVLIDLAGRRVSVDGRPIVLTQIEHDLLVYLVTFPKIAHSREQLMRGVWGYESFTDTSTVTVHIRRLRHKLGPIAQDLIQTVWGIGYRLDPAAEATGTQPAAKATDSN